MKTRVKMARAFLPLVCVLFAALVLVSCTGTYTDPDVWAGSSSGGSSSGGSSSGGSSGLTAAEQKAIQDEIYAAYAADPDGFAQIAAQVGLPANPHNWTSSQWDLVYAAYSNSSGDNGNSKPAKLLYSATAQEAYDKLGEIINYSGTPDAVKPSARSMQDIMGQIMSVPGSWSSGSATIIDSINALIDMIP
jgi:hypothetical protein